MIENNRKRRFDDENEGEKRFQDHRIHSDVHNYTVAMMLGAKQVKEEVIEETRVEDEYRQKPYWPVITRVKS